MCSRTGSRAQVKGKWFYLTNPSPVLQRCRSPISTNQTISSWPALSPGRGKEGPFSISPSCLVIESVFNQVAWLQCNGFHLLSQWVGLSVSLSVAVSQVNEQGKAKKHLFTSTPFSLVTFSPGRLSTYLPRFTSSLSQCHCCQCHCHLHYWSLPSQRATKGERGRGGHFHPHALPG